MKKSNTTKKQNEKGRSSIKTKLIGIIVPCVVVAITIIMIIAYMSSEICSNSQQIFSKV